MHTKCSLYILIYRRHLRCEHRENKLDGKRRISHHLKGSGKKKKDFNEFNLGWKIFGLFTPTRRPYENYIEAKIAGKRNT